MNRRHFLSTTALGGLGVVALSGVAKAFSLQDCEAEPRTTACEAIARHDAVIAQLDAVLTEQGIGEAERKTILSTALCPFCSLPLSPS